MDDDNNSGVSKKKKDDDPMKQIKPTDDLNNVTILGTPLPQATSTVDRRSLKGGKSYREESLSGKNRQLNFDNSSNVAVSYNNINNNNNNNNNTTIAQDSSLGIIQFDTMSHCTNLLDNYVPVAARLKNIIRNLEPGHEHELDLKTLMKYESVVDAFSKLDKENNVNSTNLPKTPNFNSNNVHNLKSRRSLQSSSPQMGKTFEINNKTNYPATIIFEPREMSARSSEYSNTGEVSKDCPSESKSEKSKAFTEQNFSGISYNSNMGDVMAQFGDEEFMSGSKVGNQMLADELAWKKGNFESTPTSKSENDRLDLSCFSGVIGSGDLTVEDGRVSVGEFFQRKCGAIGHLSVNSALDRPSLGFDTHSIEKPRKCRPLVDQTIIAEECTKDQSILSLSNIAQLLQNMEDVTPTKLVDKIMEANKKTKKKKANSPSDETNTILSRLSLPANSCMTIDKMDKTIKNRGHKLSLDSKNFSQASIGNFSNQKLRKFLEMDNYSALEDTTLKSNDFVSSQQNDNKSKTSASNKSVPRADCSPMPSLRWKLSQLPYTQNDSNKTDPNNDVSSFIHDTPTAKCDKSDPTLLKNDSTFKEITVASLRDSSLKHRSFDSKTVRIGENAKELYTCLVNIPREADFKVCNDSDRWIVCKLEYQIQGEKDNIEITLPTSDILIEPNREQYFPIGVKISRMGKLIIVNFKITCLDMVTKKSWSLNHLTCFVPEEPDIKIFIPSEDSIINFQMITEDTSSSVPITLSNNNNIDVPVILRLRQNKPELFSVNCSLDKSLNNMEKSIVLKSKTSLTINVDFKGVSLQSFGGEVYQKGLYCAKAKLIISICFKENEEYPSSDVELKGFLGCCKLDIVDTEFPLMLQPGVVKFINIKNSGCIVLMATVDVIQSKENQTTCRDFSICPNNVMLNEGDKLALQITFKPENNKTGVERQAMIRIALGNKLSFYPVIGEQTAEADIHFTDNHHHLQRCETPQHLRSVNSSTSPQSLCFNSPVTSGRQSPCSTVSSGKTGMRNVLPLRATHTSLVWGSIKVGKSDVKQFTIRNTSNSKLKMYISIKSDDHCFKFLKNKHSATSMVLSLQGMESKTLFITFAPTSAKATAGRVILSHHDCLNENRELSGVVKVIKLFGYGGYGKIEISKAVKDTSGQMWLSLGKLDSEGILHSKIKLSNRGDLTCFVKAKLIPKALSPSGISNWRIEPHEVLLAPKETQWISLEFRPRKDDLPHVHQAGVMHVGTLKLTHGDEPTRLRLRRLYNKLKDSGELPEEINEHSDEFRETINQISKAFPGETFIQDLRSIGDSVQNLGDLCKGIVQDEIKLTIEIPIDETMSMLHDNMEDSQTFYSLCSNQDNVSHFGGESYLPPE